MATTSRRCAPRSDAPVRETNPFPVFPGEPRIDGPIRKSTMGRRRALVLGAVYVVILAHVTHWLVTGSTLTPVEPSEAMETLELGRVNAGFVFFALAILSTAVFGRFACGWGCHLVALQDACAWLMRRAGVRPRPFRSRLLAWVPMGLALYMFVWPTFRRVALVPALKRAAPSAAGLFEGRSSFPGFTGAFTTRELWETFPPVWIAVPFLLIVGFAVVYLLGAKGFCTYGCPYGAVFGAADKVAPGRIRVTDACNQCGHCTATCTSNVRVHEEVRRYGMVVDSGCMKCQDCVSVCPNDALYFGFGKSGPRGLAAKPAPVDRRHDLTLRGDVLALALFAAVLLAHRGVYDAVPLLMAVGLAACTTFLGWMTLRTLRERSVRLQSLILKKDGRMRGAGFFVVTGSALLLALASQSAFVQWSRARAEAWDRRVTVSAEAALSFDRPSIAPETALAATRAAELYRRADALAAGGAGLLPTPGIAARRAWLALVSGRPSDAVTQLRRAAEETGAPDARLHLARVLALAGRHAEAVAEARALIAEDPGAPAPHRELAGILERAGDIDGAVAERTVLVNLAPQDVEARHRLADLLERSGRPREADRYR